MSDKLFWIIFTLFFSLIFAAQFYVCYRMGMLEGFKDTRTIVIDHKVSCKGYCSLDEDDWKDITAEEVT